MRGILVMGLHYRARISEKLYRAPKPFPAPPRLRSPSLCNYELLKSALHLRSRLPETHTPGFSGIYISWVARVSTAVCLLSYNSIMAIVQRVLKGKLPCPDTGGWTKKPPRLKDKINAEPIGKSTTATSVRWMLSIVVLSNFLDMSNRFDRGLLVVLT